MDSWNITQMNKGGFVMEKFKLVVREDQCTGETGLMLEGVKMINTPMVSLEGLTIAHDILEHQNGLKSIGPVDDEIEALGGCWFVRGQHGRFGKGSSYYSVEESLASDIQNLCEIYMGGVEFKSPIEDTTEEVFWVDSILDFVEWDSEEIKDASENHHAPEERLKIFKNKVKAYLISGYDKAVERFGFHNAYEINNLFFEIADRLNDNVIPYIEAAYQQWELTIDFDSYAAFVDEVYEFEEEGDY